VWWILTGLLLLVVWALWFVLDLFFDVWIGLPIIATSVIFVIAVVIFVIRKVRASRSANALEKAIAQQGAQQALNARPERRAEIQELQKQVQGGINALKSSKLGAGKKTGAAALYSLPWYVIIGPPGAGKTTALKHSGLVFPYADPSGGGVRGVGGTRNCDWWFTNEAILLDTAGRYTTEQDDRDEWISFLHMLLKYRSRQPLNGILVAISVADLIDANEQQIEATGKKIRARIDEVMTHLHMVLPVYVLFTKCDLIAGFSEFFGDLRKSDRAQAWGSTLKLDLVKAEPGKIFDEQFDVLCKQVHARALKRLAMERSREAREKLFQFPLEFAGIKRNLSELISNVFMANAFQGTPIFRGFYFTSGTQEGKPLDRVLGRMGQAMGIRPPETAAQQVVESKSYFLHDVFMNVVFPDGSIAARSQSEIRRQLLMRVAISGAAFMLATIVAIPSVISWFNNRAFLKETEDRARVASTITWGDGQPVTTKIDLLSPVLARLQEMDTYKAEGVPFNKGMYMYQGEEIYRPTVRIYVANMQNGFVIPCQQRLETRLRAVTGDKYLKERTDLKMYLMLSDVANLDVEWATGRYTALWAEVNRSSTNIGEDKLKAKLVDHVRYYLNLLKNGTVQPLPANADLVAKTRKTLQAVPVPKRYYDQFINTLIDEKYNEAGDATRENQKYPPFTLGEMFADRPEVLKVLKSKQHEEQKRWKEVEGPYTEEGHYAVLENIAAGEGLLQIEQWVVPLTEDERGDKVAVHLRRLANDYDTRYIDQWADWLRDVKVVQPQTLKEAIETYRILINPDWPFLRILRKLADHTQWKKVPSAFENEAGVGLVNQKLRQYFSQKTGGLRLNIDIRKLGEKVSDVPGAFKRTVEFGILPDNRQPGAFETPLSKYIAILEKLRGEMIKIDNPNSGLDPRILQERLLDESKQSAALFQPFDERAKALLYPLLLDPLQILGTPKLTDAGVSRFPPPPNRFQPPPRR
jgi:type VI secretion system protein ImpL